MNFSNLNFDHVKNENCRKGFTLIELLVVIFVIGILAGLILPNLVSSRQRARDSRRKHDLVEIKNAMRLYYNDHQAYPGSLPSGNWTVDGATYMQEVPTDPKAGTYSYCVDTDDYDSFVLAAQLENSGDPDMVESMDRCQASVWNAETGCDLTHCQNADTNEFSECYYICAN